MSPCLPDVYIFVLRCLYPRTDKHNLIGYPKSLLLEEMAATRQWEAGSWGWGGVSKHSACQGHCRSTPTLHPPCTPQHMQPLWWELWQRLVDNLKLQFTESNYPEHDFPNIPQSGVVLLILAACFWRILLNSVFRLCTGGLNAAKGFGRFFFSCADTSQRTSDDDAFLRSFYHPQTAMPPSAVSAAEECDD